MFNKLIFTTLIISSLSTLAHEGHNNTPGSLKANHGGTVKSGKEMNLEYVALANELKLYPADHEGTDLTAAELKVSVTGKIPKGKTENLKVELKNGIYTVPIDFKNAYRIEVIVTVDYKGKKDSFKFQVEK